MNWLRRGRHLAVKAGNNRRVRNKNNKSREEWKEKETMEEGSGLMVKGLSRRVIVVKAPDERIFEQAIFIIREDFAATAGVSEKEIMRQAKKAANDYLGACGFSGGSRFLRWLRPPLYAAAGAAATAAAWFAFHMSVI